MKFFLLTDDADAMMGMRLAGIEGRLVKTAEKAFSEYENARSGKIGILLITHSVAEMFGEQLIEMKKLNTPLIVEIPDSNPDHNPADAVSDYIRNAIGIKI